MKYLSLFLSLRYLCRRKMVFLILAAVALSCGLLVGVASLFSSFIATVESSADDHMGDVVIQGPDHRKIPRADELARALEGHSDIHVATGVLSSQGILWLGKGNVRGVKIWGIEMPQRNEVTVFEEALIRQRGLVKEASFAWPEAPDEIGGFVGIGVLAEPDPQTDEYDFAAVKKAMGSKVMLTTGGLDEKKSLQIETIKFRLSDVVFTGVYMFDEAYLFLPLGVVAERLYPGLDDPADMIQIKLADGVKPEIGLKLVQEVWDEFARDTLGWGSFLISMATVDTPRKLQEDLVREYRKQMGVLMLVFGIVSSGVVLLIFCIFYMIVMTQRRDIAILKSCGLGSWSAAMIFIVFGLVLGVVGSLLGVGLGYLVTENANSLEQTFARLFGLKLWKSSTYMFSRIPAQMNWTATWWVFVFSSLAATIGSLIPAISAARVRPVKLLTYE